MYQFHYRLNDDDFIAFNKYHFDTSAAGKKSQLLMRLLVPFMSILIIAVFYVADVSRAVLTTEAITLAILSVIWAFIAKKIFFYSFKKNLNQLRKDGKLPYPSEGTLIFDEESFKDINSTSETKMLYSNVEKIGVSKEAIYIYISAVQANILPNTCFHSDEEKQRFLAFLTAMVNRQKGQS